MPHHPHHPQDSSCSPWALLRAPPGANGDPPAMLGGNTVRVRGPEKLPPVALVRFALVTLLRSSLLELNRVMLAVTFAADVTFLNGCRFAVLFRVIGPVVVGAAEGGEAVVAKVPQGSCSEAAGGVTGTGGSPGESAIVEISGGSNLSVRSVAAVRAVSADDAVLLEYDE